MSTVRKSLTILAVATSLALAVAGPTAADELPQAAEYVDKLAPARTWGAEVVEAPAVVVPGWVVLAGLGVFGAGAVELAWRVAGWTGRRRMLAHLGAAQADRFALRPGQTPFSLLIVDRTPGRLVGHPPPVPATARLTPATTVGQRGQLPARSAGANTVSTAGGFDPAAAVAAVACRGHQLDSHPAPSPSRSRSWGSEPITRTG